MHRAVILLLTALALPLSAEVLAPPVPVMSPPPGPNTVLQMWPSLAVSGGRAVVVWTDWPWFPSPVFGWFGTIRAAAGTLPEPAPNTVTLFGSAGMAIVAPLADGSFFLAWESSGGFFTGRMTGDARVVTDVRMVITPENVSSGMAIGTSSERLLLTWYVQMPSQPEALYGALFDREGHPVGIPFLIARTNLQNATRPSIASDGTNFLVVWGETNSSATVSMVRGVRLDGTGALYPGSEQVIATDGYRTDVAWDGRHYGVVWESSPRSLGIRARRLAADGSPHPDVTILTNGSKSDAHPQIEWDGWGYTVAFTTTEAVTVMRYNTSFGQATLLGEFRLPYWPRVVELRVASGVAHVVYEGGDYRLYYTSGALPSPPPPPPVRRRLIQ